MKVAIPANDLVKGLTTVSRALSSRSQLPVLANVLIQAQKSGLTLAATNLEVGIRSQIGGKVDIEGDITIPARSLVEFISSVGNVNVTLESESGKLQVNAGKFRASFAGIDASEFPVLPTITKSTTPGISAQILTEIAASVAYAAAVDESRPVLTGVRFQMTDDRLIVVATDGFRLSRKIIPLNSKLFALGSNLILPAKTIQEAARLVQDTADEEVKIDMVEKNNQVIFSIGHTDLISRILEGNYPDTEKIIPVDFPVETVIDRIELLQGVKAAGIFAREDNNIIRIKIQESRIKISARAVQQGESEVEIEADNSGEGEIAFNYKYVTDVLNSMAAERIKLQMKDHLSPGVFRPEKDSTLLALIMPVRI